MASQSNSTALKLRPFGRTGMSVTPICLGAGSLGDVPQFYSRVSEEQAFDLVRAVFKSPIKFLDTSANYSEGESERRIGVVIRQLGGLPPGYVLQTKADRDSSSNDFSGEQVRRSVERSRVLLGLEHIPIVQLHDPEFATTTFEELMAPGGAVDVLAQYKAQGIVGAIGVAGGAIDVMTRFVETGAFDAVLTHNRYTLICRSADKLLDLAAGRGMAVLNAAIYNGGMLAKGPDHWTKFAYREASPQLVATVREMESLCIRHEVPLAAAALQFSLRDRRITSTIVGMGRSELISETIALAHHPIPEELWPQLDSVARRSAVDVD